MFLVDRLLLLAAVLLLLGIVSSKLSARFGVPVLVAFLGVGVLAGSEGLGKIPFENYPLAHAIGTVALAVILFDGGLRTSLDAFRVGWKPALSLATAGVLITSVLTGLAASWALGIPPLMGVLLGSIVGSTDAAAVFSVLRNRGVRLSDRLSSTLEIESGSNDPMAVFLTLALIQLILGEAQWGPGLLVTFAMQMGVGLLVGIGWGWLALRLIGRLNLDSAGLYPVLTCACGLIAFGAAAVLGGSGFLAVYVAGIVLGNGKLVFRRGALLFHDGLAWVSQILMFAVLGLLSFPSRIAEALVPGLLVSLVLILVARPLAVFVTLLPFRFTFRELVFLSWVGLKGAVPIVLATFPFLFGLPGAERLFDVVFVTVLVSAVTQGWSLPLVATKLGLRLPSVPESAVALEITALRDVNGEIVEYTLAPDARGAGKRLRDLALPEGVVVALVVRGGELIAPGGATELCAGDHVFVVLKPEARAAVDLVLSEPGDAPPALPGEMEFPLRGAARVSELEEFYGVRVHEDGSRTLGQVVFERLGAPPRIGDRVEAGGLTLVVREISPGGAVETLGLIVHDEALLEADDGDPGPDA